MAKKFSIQVIKKDEVDIQVTEKDKMMDNYFHSNGIKICRRDYEHFSDPLCARNFSDKQMQQLADNIAYELMYKYGYSESEIRRMFDKYTTDECNNFNDLATQIIEECALDMGMVYYSDLDIDSY
jgi:hypothetical protein